jgi:zinc transport system substrate-binding protein
MPRWILLAFILVAFGWPAAAADPPVVVVSIRPLYGLAASLMRGIGEPRLLLGGAGSPHGHALRPSEARDLQEAALVLLVGAGLDGFVERHLQEDKGRAVVRMSEVDGVHVLPARLPGFAGEGRPDHDHGGDGPRIDPHLWLDPRNALAFVDAVAMRLATLDPARSPTYRQNHADLRRRLEDLDRETALRLEAAAGRPLISFHDALQYFTARYGLDDPGAIASDPERAPGARTIRALRERLQHLGPVCIALEAGAEPALLEPVREGLPVAIARLDPLGRGIAPGEQHYERMIEGLADEALRCLRAPVQSP